MKCFYRTFKAMEDSHPSQHQLVFLMSLLAEISRKQEKVRLPFTRNIALALLSFDLNTIDESHKGNQILAILAVLLENLSRQGKAVVKLGVEEQLKKGLLLLTSRVDELFTLRILLKAIRQLPHPNFTREELEKSGITASLSHHFGNQAAIKVKVMLCHLTGNRSSG
jgi:hypothetical protein